MKYGSSSLQLRPRLVRTCLKNFLDPSRSLGEHYGAINGISSIGGPEAIRAIVLPNLKAYEYVILKAQTDKGVNDIGVKMIIAAVVKAVESIAGESSSLINGADEAVDEAPLIEEYLGTIIGSRIATKGNHKLNKALLEAKEKSQ